MLSPPARDRRRCVGTWGVACERPAGAGREAERRIGDERDRMIVFGHSHVQFRREGPRGTSLLNPGSVGMPLDRDVRAAWAVRTDDGEFEFRRTEYDRERAVDGWRRLGGEFSEMVVRRLENGCD